jgi:hypothetical protein
MAKTAGGDHIFIPPASKEVVHSMSEYRYTMESATISCYGANIYCTSDSPLSSTQIADGCGYDSELGLPYKMIGMTYIITHEVDDFAIASVEPNTIRVYQYSGGDFVLFNKYDHSAASRTNPIETEVDDQSGPCQSARNLTSPVLVVGTSPFYLRTNAQNSDEYSVIGYKVS